MKKVLGCMVMVCCISIAKGQDEDPGGPSHSLERTIKILKSMGIIKDAVYDKHNMKLAEPVHVPLHNADDSLLQRIFAEQPFLKYSLIANRLAISLKSKAEMEESRAHFEYRIWGMVLNDSANPLPGATVQLRSRRDGVATDSLGNFSIVWSIGDTLEISHVSFKPYVVAWKRTKRPVIVQLISKDPMPPVAITTGYFSREKGSTAGASQVKVGNIAGGDVLQIIQENISGVLAPPSSGLPGTTHRFQFRGPTSLGAVSEQYYRPSSSPLFVVNGVPWAPSLRPVNQLTTMVGEPQAPGIAATGMDPFFTINSLDIESITLLKDAEATAIYGARGANGVILITTKKGISKEPRLTISVSYGAGRSLPTMSLMNTPEYLAMRREALQNDNITPTPARAPDLLLWDTTRNLDVSNLLLSGTANSLNEHFSFSQGDSLFQVLLNGGFSSQSSVLPSNIYGKRWSLLADFSFRSKNKKLKTGLSVYHSISENKWLTDNIMYATLLAPNAPNLRDSVGNLVWKDKGVAFRNPLSYFQNIDYIQTGNTLLHAYVQYKIFSRLRFETSIGYQRVSVEEMNKLPASAQNPDRSPTGSYNEANNRFTTWIVEPGLHYTDSFWKNIQVQALLGASWSSQVNDRWKRSYSGYTNDELLGIPSAAQASTYTPDKSRYLFLSTFARIRLNYKSKYLLSLTVRRDGSSRFGPENRYANFGAIGAGWIFWEGTTRKGYNSFAKLRGSYGSSGNDQIGDYAYLNIWNTAAQNYQGLNGIYPNGLANPFYQWEVTRKLEGGLELNISKTLNANITAYRNRSKNQLISYVLPGQTGFGTVVKNFPAIIENTGIEVDAAFKNGWGDFSWCSKLTLAIPKNKLVRFDDLENSNYANKLRVGKPLNISIGPAYSGVDTATGLFSVADPEAKLTGNLDPVFFGGLHNSFRFKQVELATYFEFRQQKALHYLTYTYRYLPPGQSNINDPFYSNQPAELNNRWHQRGDEAPWQKVSVLTTGAVKNAISNWVNSDASLVNASYLRLKMIQLAYAFPEKFCTKRHIKAASVYTSAENLFTITPFKGADPELQVPFSLPLQKTITIGIQVTL